jgi:hypothetical protein
MSGDISIGTSLEMFSDAHILMCHSCMCASPSFFYFRTTVNLTSSASYILDFDRQMQVFRSFLIMRTSNLSGGKPKKETRSRLPISSKKRLDILSILTQCLMYRLFPACPYLHLFLFYLIIQLYRSHFGL